MEKAVIIGAGISGLACAYRLKQLGVRPLVLETGDRPGGVIATVRRNGFVFETGPQFPRFPASVWQLMQELGLRDEFVAGDSKAKRFIYRGGRLHPAPFSPGEFAATRLVSLKSKLRVLAEPFGRTQPPQHEESLAEFVQRKFGAEMLDNLVDPFISTIFFGDAEHMGMESAFPALVQWERNAGSLVRGALRAREAKHKSGSNANSLRVTDSLPALGSFKFGMATLPEALAEALREEIRYGARIASVMPKSSDGGATRGSWTISLTSGEQIAAEHLVFATPSYAAAQLLEPSAAPLAAQLKAIEYAPICVVSSAYERAKVAHHLDGFGLMVPRREGLNTICTFWNSSLFANRAPSGTVLMTSFAARQLAANLAARSDKECAQTVEAENARILGITGPSLSRVVWKDSRALPQYNVGHARRVSEISSILQTNPTLHMIGNFLKGRSIGDCVDLANRVADDVHSQLRGQNI